MKTHEVTTVTSGPSVEQVTTVTVPAQVPITNNWDAICAMDSGQVTALFLRQYLENGPTSPSTPLQLIGPTNDPSVFWALNASLGPPDVAFPASLPAGTARLSMFLVKGQLIRFNANTREILSVVTLGPNGSLLTGDLNLSTVTGTVNELGSVVVSLGAGSWTPKIDGIDPNSPLPQQIGEAIASFFANQSASYKAGSITDNEVPTPLKPTSFSFYTQQNPNDPSDGCLLLLITTTGSPGLHQPLTTYPIADGYSAALIISNRVIFGELMPPALNTEFSKIGATFSGVSGTNGYVATASGGAVNLGNFAPCIPGPLPYSSNADGTPEPFEFPITGFTVGPGGQGVQASWNSIISQDFGYIMYPNIPSVETAQFQVTFNELALPSVDPVSDVVTFSGSATTSIASYDTPGWWAQAFGEFPVAKALSPLVQTALGSVLGTFQAPGVDAFALSNLLFPREQALSLQNATVPCDLIINGKVKSFLEVSPGSVNVAPGGQQQFTVTIGGQASTDILWEIRQGPGTISASGLYTAPASVPSAEAVVIAAVNRANTSDVGYGFALVFEQAANTGIVISPAELILNPGQSYTLTILDNSDPNGQINCTLSPNVGSISQGFGTGAWIYTAPAQAENLHMVTVTATNASNPSQTGRSRILVLPTETITMNPASASLKAGQSVTITASPGDLEGYTWIAGPTGSGTITPNPSNPAQATYTAPANVSSPIVALVAVFSVSESAGVGVAAIRVEAQSSVAAG